MTWGAIAAVRLAPDCTSASILSSQRPRIHALRISSSPRRCRGHIQNGRGFAVDDILAAAARAGTKTVGVVIDDAAVTPRYVKLASMPGARAAADLEDRQGVDLQQGLGCILLPAAVLLGQFAPFLIPIILIGGRIVPLLRGSREGARMAACGRKHQCP